MRRPDDQYRRDRQSNPIGHAPLGRFAGRCRESTLLPALLGSLLLWMAYPPCGLWPLAWIAPTAWLGLISRPSLPGRRPYRNIYLAGALFWLLTLHWLRLPHRATFVGWFALAGYLAVYLPAFVAFSRMAVHTLRIPLAVAAPMVWTGLELTRAHLLTGFLIAALGHTQVDRIALIQISDLGGAYAVSFLVMLIAAVVTRVGTALVILRQQGWPAGCTVAWRVGLANALWGTAVLGGTLVYGHLRSTDVARHRGPRVALIQGAIVADWKADPNKAQRIFQQYFELSVRATEEANGAIDLIVWPETMFPNALQLVDREDPPDKADMPPARIRGFMPGTLAEMVRRLGVPVMVGIATIEYAGKGDRRYNSVIVTNRKGSILGRYDKIDLVMFGEYVPLARWFPSVYRWTPFGQGLAPGDRPVVFDVAGFRFAPNICFETVLPQTIRSQVRQLQQQGQPPDVLVNLTNDAWFRGSSELDMHLACGVFRAIECRKPLLIAANAGISAAVDSAAGAVRRGPRQATDVLITQVQIDERTSLYLQWGDWFAGICLAGCLALAGVGLWNRVLR
ncbi:MAG: apolipoprotein N-acyltransferase [Pirellulales bacterium]